MNMGDPANCISQTSLHMPMLQHTWNLSCKNTVGVPECVRALNLSDTFASTSFTSFDHDRPANLFGLRQPCLTVMTQAALYAFWGIMWSCSDNMVSVMPEPDQAMVGAWAFCATTVLKILSQRLLIALPGGPMKTNLCLLAARFSGSLVFSDE